MKPLVVRPGKGPVDKGPVGGPLEFKVRAEQSDGGLTALVNDVALPATFRELGARNGVTVFGPPLAVSDPR